MIEQQEEVYIVDYGVAVLPPDGCEIKFIEPTFKQKAAGNTKTFIKSLLQALPFSLLIGLMYGTLCFLSRMGGHQ